MKEFLIGSRVFFSDIEGFEDLKRDYDILIIDDTKSDELLKDETSVRMYGDYHIITWYINTKEEFLSWHKTSYHGVYIQKFLCPDFALYLGLTIEDLKSIGHLVNYLDEEYNYVKTVYDFYIANNGFYLTPAQKEEAYKVYKKDRGIE